MVVSGSFVPLSKTSLVAVGGPLRHTMRIKWSDRHRQGVKANERLVLLALWSVPARNFRASPHLP